MKRPLTGLVVAFASGILVGSWIGWPVIALGVAVATAVGLFFLFRRTALLWLTVFCAGMWAFRFSTTNSEPNHITQLLSARDQNVNLRGVIIDDPGYREADEEGQRHSFKLRLQALKRTDVWESACGTVLIFVSEARVQSPLQYGDAIECSAILRVPPPASNPGTFDWRRWLGRQNIQFTATIRVLDDCHTVATNQGNPVVALSFQLRERFARALRIGLEDQPRLAGVLAGMVIGERSEIPEDTYADFQQTGVFHVFAISGLHVGIVTLVVVTALRLIRVPRRWCAVVAIPLLILYVFATGARPGAVRALIMASVWLGSWLLVRPADALNNLAAAALVILVGQPAQLFEGGFLLSFAVVLSLLVLGTRIEKFFLPWIETDPLLPAELVPGWRRWLEGPLRWFVRLVSWSMASWIGLLPLMAVYFNLFTPVSIIANVIVIPLVGVIIPIGMLSAALPPAAAILNNANFFLLHAMLQIVDWLGSFRWGHWFVQAPPLWITVGFYAFLAAQLAGLLRLRWLALFGMGVLTLAAWPRDVAEITVLDLRDGVSVFVNLPGEDDDLLIDGGSDWSGGRVVLPFLRGQGVDRLATVVLTRGDKAHAAGLQTVAQRVPVRQALHAGTGSRSKFFWDWLAAMRKQGLEIVTLRAGDERHAGKFTMRTLHPPAGANSNRSDDNSLVLLLEYAGTRVLLASDIGETVERQLIAGRDLRAPILIKGRHSQEASGTDPFLDAVQPAVVIQSVGTQPSTRYLQPDLRDRLRARGIKFHRTDETGAVTIRLQGGDYTIQTCFATADAAR